MLVEANNSQKTAQPRVLQSHRLAEEGYQPKHHVVYTACEWYPAYVLLSRQIDSSAEALLNTARHK